MRHSRFPAIMGALGLSAMLMLLRTAAFPAWFAHTAVVLLPPVCLYAALRSAAIRTQRLRHATRLHQAEQQRLVIACQLLHSQVDLLTGQRRNLLAQLAAEQALCDTAPLRRASGE